jgi:alginate O-acetyltransferase complex protein AlgJ
MALTRVEKLILLFIVSLFVLPTSVKIIPKFVTVTWPLPQSFGRDLVGVTIDEPRPSLSLHGWFTREFQNQFSKWFNQSYGARPFFVRMGNQLNYSLFNKSSMASQWIIIGHHGQLYGDEYVKDYCNPPPAMPMSLMETRVKEIANLQYLLARKGVGFLLLITPSKAAIYPEYIPSNLCHARPSSKRDYDNFVPLLDKHHVNYVDGHVITQQATQIERAPLFCQGGLHWNYLGAYYTVRALIDELKGLLNRKAGRLDLEAVNVDHTPTWLDKDLAGLLNLFFPPFDFEVPHPVISMKGGTEDLGRAVIVGTSFNWFPIDLYDKHKVFKEIDFLYYYKVLYSFPGQRSLRIDQRGHVALDVAKIDWENTILKSDVIILEVNEAKIPAGYSSAFVSDALQHLHNFSPKSEAS